jgi:hypothetical protein
MWSLIEYLFLSLLDLALPWLPDLLFRDWPPSIWAPDPRRKRGARR